MTSPAIFMTMEMESAQESLLPLTKVILFATLKIKGDGMGEFKREIEIIKEECARNPGACASWIGIAILFGICCLLGLLTLMLIV